MVVAGLLCQAEATLRAAARLNQRADLTCSETASVEHSFGFAPPKHQLSPPISVVMSALLIQQGGLRGPGSDGARAYSVLLCVWREPGSCESSEVS